MCIAEPTTDAGGEGETRNGGRLWRNGGHLSEELWGYDEPVEGGGNSHVTMTRAQAIALMHSVYPGVYEGNDEQAFDDWVVVHWAYKEDETKGRAEQTVKEYQELAEQYRIARSEAERLAAEIAQVKQWNTELTEQLRLSHLSFAAARGREDTLRAENEELRRRLDTLSARDAEQLIHDIEHPAPANEELRKSFEAYKEVVEEVAG